MLWHRNLSTVWASCALPQPSIQAQVVKNVGAAWEEPQQLARLNVVQTDAAPAGSISSTESSSMERCRHHIFGECDSFVCAKSHSTRIRGRLMIGGARL